MNLYNFFNIVYEKLKLILQDSFALDSGQMRLPRSDFDETIRECLVNCLAHADYVQAYAKTFHDIVDGLNKENQINSVTDTTEGL